jgi:hypothetical protein
MAATGKSKKKRSPSPAHECELTFAEELEIFDY